MSISTIEKDFVHKVSEKIRLSPDGEERFRVLTPFQFEDGDQLVIVLKKVGDRWVLSDEAHTYMHLTYDIDEKLLHRGARRKIILNALSMFDVKDRNGELTLDVSDERYGDALYDFVQALLKITDVSYLSKEQIKSTFIDDFRTLFYEGVQEPEKRVFFDWSDQNRDPQKNYKVDCLINREHKPLLVYALANDNRTRDATIALHQFREWGVSFHPVGIFKEPNAVGHRVLARFSDVCEDYFMGINESYASIGQYLDNNVSVISGEMQQPAIPPQSLPELELVTH